jgi:hypothetical protein
MHVTEHLNDTLNKRVGWASERTFSQDYKDDKYKLQNDNIQFQKIEN